MLWGKPTPDPLVGFHIAALYTPDSNKAITEDYKDYIQKLPPEEKKFAFLYNVFEDGTGQHAVKIEVDVNGTDRWFHILIYDKDNKRIRVIKYYNGRYQS